jgi:large repetitive protein
MMSRRNNAPDARDDILSATEDNRLVVAASRLLSNDRDSDNDRLRITSVGCASNCRVSIDCDGNVVIIPMANFSGVATFQYTVSDGRGGFDTATVSVNVGAVADAASLSVSNAHGTADTAIALNIAAALTDTDGSESLKIVIGGVPGGATLSHGTRNSDGTWTLTKAQLAGLTITPPTGSDADFNLTVKAITTESSNGNTATVTKTLAVTVDPASNTQPVLIVTDATGNEDQAIALNINAQNATSVVIAGVPAGAVLSAGTHNANGTWTLTAAQLVGLTITPPANSDVDFNLTVTITGAGDCDDDDDHHDRRHGNEGVGNGEDPPPPGHSYNWNDGAGTSPGRPGSRGGRDDDDRDSRSSGRRDDDDDDHDHGYGNDNHDDEDHDDCDHDDDCEVVTITKTLHVTVKAVADMPTLVASVGTGSSAAPIPLNISAALTDTDGSESLLVRVSGLPLGATLSAGTQVAGVWTLTAAQLAGLTLTVPSGTSGDFVLRVEAQSTEAENGDTKINAANLNLHLTVPSQPPVAQNDSNTAIEDGGAINGNVLDNDFDPDAGSVLSVVSPGNQSGIYGTLTLNASGVYTYTQNAGAQALAAGETVTVTFTYRAQDQFGSQSGLATLTITLTGVNDAPVVAGALSMTAVEDGALATLNLLTGASDIDHGFVLHTANYSGLLPGMSVTGNTLTVDASSATFQSLAAGAIGSYVVNYDVVDEHGALVHQTATVRVTGVNDAPVAADDNVYVQEDLLLSASGNVITGPGADIDPDNGAILTIAAASVGTHVLNYGTLVLNSDGSYTYTLNNTLQVVNNLHEGEFLSDSYTYTVRDQFGVSSSATVNVSIEGHNDTPFGIADTATTFTSDPAIITVLSNDGDIEDDGLTVLIWQQVAEGHGTATVNPDGTIRYQAPDNYFTAPGETEVFYYVLRDSFGAQSAPIRVDVTVLPDLNPNVAPVAFDSTVGVDEDAYDGNVFNYFDADPLDTHTFSVETGPSHGTIQLNVTVDGDFYQWLYTPNANYYGPDHFVFRVTDSGGAFDTGTIYINVLEVPDDPTITGTDGDDDLLGTIDADIIYGGLGNDSLTGGAGADWFVFAESGTGNADTVLDFNAAEGDVIDIRDLLSSFSGNLANYIHATEVSGDTVISVSPTGSPGGFQEVATLVGVTNLNLLDSLLIDERPVLA